MGLLSVGTPLSWEETKALADHVRQHGIRQFITHYHRMKDRQGDCLKWGDEIEYMLVKFDDEKKKARVSLRGADVLHTLMEDENTVDYTQNKFLWRPEYAAYMVEGTPGMPYGGLLSCFNRVEENMRQRRHEVEKLLRPGEVILSMGNFPRLGCPDFTDPTTKPTPGVGVTQSLFFPDEVIYSAHPRFATLSRNIRERRGEKVNIQVPIYTDEKTPLPFVENLSYDPTGVSQKRVKPGHIYMDAMGFGMGCCCLQVTFQTVNVSEARWLYDQLTPMTPILLALSAATPIYRGYLADVDCRWDVIAASVDDRTLEERGELPLKNDKFRIEKSRYDTTDCYMYPCSAPFNDIKMVYDEQIYKDLLAGGIDDLMAKHVAHLFIRDPIQLYKEKVDQNDNETTEHFESLQSSNWMNMRFKPPTPENPHIGWRVEFRPTEVQLTDFENAAYVVFVVLLTRVIISFNLSLLIPISKVNENMARAQHRDAVLTQRFYFRRGVATCKSPPTAAQACGGPVDDDTVVKETITNGHCESKCVVEMTIDEIINGKQPDFPGLVPLMNQYLDSADVDVETRCTVQRYLNFIRQRASGKICTTARWIRDYVRDHPAYKGDSIVSEEVTYDLMKLMSDVASGRLHSPTLLGNFRVNKAPVVKTPVVPQMNGEVHNGQGVDEAIAQMV